MSAVMPGAAPRRAAIAWALFAFLLLATAAVYVPSLHGGYFFDDSIYFVDNPDMHVTSLQPGDWWRAAISQCGTNLLCRPLSSLSFAANYYFSGLDPFWPKLTNLAIHLANGLALFLLLRALFRLRAATRDSSDTFEIAAAALAGAWLLLPINVTGVAYVSQRMEALANLFVFLGLFAYLTQRRRIYRGGGRALNLWLALLLATAAGLSAKEDAALLPLYTALAEFAVTRFRNRDGSWCRPAIGAHIALLLLPLIAGIAWIGPRFAHRFASLRDFTLGERLLTELRVLVDYIDWTLLPNLDALTFYHDDMALSHGFLDPPTTAVCGLALLALLGAALWQRARRPLFCVGILWWFAGHSMTATIIPLELVFEHRNYFPSVGLLLAVASLVLESPRAIAPAIRIAASALFIGFFAFTTFLRCEEWSHPLRLAYSEALKRPDSARAQYSLAHTLIIAAKDYDSPLVAQSIEILKRDAASARTGIASLQALVYLSARTHRPIDPAWWQTMAQKLDRHAPSQTDLQAIIFLYHCQQRGDCPKQVPELLNVFVVAMTRSEGDVDLMSAYGDFALTDLGDVQLSERLFRGAVEAKPQVPVYRANLVKFLIETRQFDAAERAIADLAALNRFGSLDDTLAQLRQALAAKRAETPAAQDGKDTQ